MDHLVSKQRELMEKVPHAVTEKTARRMVAGLGIVEEVLEYLNSTGHKPWRPHPLKRQDQLEELTDILFFYLELIILSGFKWEEVEEEYHRKHAINLDRYKRAEQGDYTWDKRGAEDWSL